MPRTTLALKFGVYAPALMGPLFLAFSLAGEGMKLLRTGGLQAPLDVAPALLLPSVLVMSYLAFGLPALLTGILAATVGTAIEHWEDYQGACAAVGGVLSGIGYHLFVKLMGGQTPQDRALVWVAVVAGAVAAAAAARWTRTEHQEVVKRNQYGPPG